MATFVELPSDMVNEIIKYMPWSNRLVNKDFNRYIDEDNSRFLKMKIDNKTKTPFFNEEFLTAEIPFADKIKSLEITDCEDLIDIRPLSKCTALIELDLSDSYNVQNIRPLTHCLLLAKLNFTGLSGVEISPLSHCISLTDLNMNECYWTDNGVPSALDSLSKCTKLKKLDIGILWPMVQDISALSGLSSLTDLNACTLADVSVLSKLTSLENLSFIDAVNDISVLSTLKSLKTLSIASEVLQDISPLSSLTALKTLELLTDHITNILPLKECKSLNKLILSNSQNPIDISPIASQISDIHVVKHYYPEIN
jgi:internalin A